METLKTKYCNTESKFIEVGGVNVHYKEEGLKDGPVLLMMHGVCASLFTWDGWITELKDHYRLIRLDLPGWGLTGPVASDWALGGPIKEGETEYNRENFVKFLDLFMNALEIKKFSIAGNSFGAFVGWNYSLVYPEKVEKMVLLDPVGYPHNAPWIIDLVGLPILGNIGRVIMPRPIITNSIKNVYGDPSRIEDGILDLYFDMAMRPGNKSSYYKILKQISQGTNPNTNTVCKDIKRITTPTLLMWGRDDKWVPVHVLEEWKRDVKDVKYIVYDGVGHVGMEEIPKRTARDAHSFLSGKS